jgi:uroporphyrinogen-III synthase
VLLGLGGGCSMPLGVLVEPLGGRFRMHAALFGGSPNAALREASIGDDPTAMAAALVEAWRPLVGEPLRGMRLATIRPDGGRTGLCAALAIAGADVTSLAWTAVEPTAPSREGLADVLACDALAFTSARAATHFAAACRAHGLAPFARPALAVGAATASELLRLGCEDVRVADGRGGASLAALCADAGVASVGLPCAMERHDGFERAATARGVDVLPLPVYRLRQVDGGGAAPYHLDAVLFTSPSAVDAWCERAGDRAVRAVAIGATTTTALTERGFKALTTLREPTPAALIAALTAAGGSR